MKFLLAFLLFPITVLGQSVQNGYSDSLARSNAPQIKLAVTTYLSANMSNWKDYEERQWSIASIYTRYEDTPEEKIFEKNAAPMVNCYKKYSDSLMYLKKTGADSLSAGFKNMVDSTKKYKDLVNPLYAQYLRDKKQFTPTLRYYIVDFFIRKKGSTDVKDAEAYSGHVQPDFKIHKMIHVSKDPM